MGAQDPADPALAFYLGLTAHERQHSALLEEVRARLRRGLGAGLLDLDLLAHRLRGQRLEPSLGLVPFVPLSCRAWALLRSVGVQALPGLPDTGAIATVQRSLSGSFMAQYGPAGMRLLRQAIHSQEAR